MIELAAILDCVDYFTLLVVWLIRVNTPAYITEGTKSQTRGIFW